MRVPGFGLGRQRDGWWPLVLGPDVCACGLHWAACSIAGYGIYSQSTTLTLRSFFGQLQVAETSWRGTEGTGRCLRPRQPCSGRPSSSMACSLSRSQTHGISPAMSLPLGSVSLSTTFLTHHLTPRFQPVGTSFGLRLPVWKGERGLNCGVFCRAKFPCDI